MTLWLSYTAWIVSLILFAKKVDVWQPVLTKSTFVWGITTGFILLNDAINASDVGFFREKFFEIASITVIYSYLRNEITFSILAEGVFHIILFVAIALPAVAEQPRERRIASSARTVVVSLLTVIFVIHIITGLMSSWKTIEWPIFIFKGIWPMILGAWVLVFLFPLSIYSGYEQVLIKVKMYPDTETHPWKAMVGLMLALGFRLSWIREARKGGAITYDVAYAESICDAYEKAKDRRFELD